MRQKGFTLIELLLAIGLSALLLLVAIMTFRSVTRTMGDLNRLAEQNKLIRSGFFLVMDEADYWQSHANPAYPYLQRHQIGQGDANEAADKRLFSPAVWPKSLDAQANPNWNQPHDERGWFRNHLRPNLQTGAYMVVNKAKAPGLNSNSMIFRPDFGVRGELTNNPETSAAVQTFTIDPGWDFWHIVGDYASIANVEMKAGKGDADYVAGSRPVQFWEIFAELGVAGLYHYVPAGSLNMIQTSARNYTLAKHVDVETRMDNNFSKGEIPWSLQANGKAVVEWELQVLDGPRPAGDSLSYPSSFAQEFPDYNRRNWVVSMPTIHDANREIVAGMVRFGFTSDLDAFATDARSAPIMMSLYEGQAGRGQSYGAAAISTMALQYPPMPEETDFGSDAYDWYQFDIDVVKPVSVIDLGRDYTSSNVTSAMTESRGRMYADNHYRDLVDRSTYTTWHIPQRHTGAFVGKLSERELAGGGLATSIRRYHYNGNDKAHCTIRLIDPTGDVNVAYRVNVISTTLRGARQYWGRLSGASGVSDGFGNRVVMGDRYE